MFTPAAVQFTNAVAEQACADYPLSSDLCTDEIEKRIVRAYVQLVFQAVDTDNSRSVVVMRPGSLAVRLTELRPADANPGLPPLWLEVFDWPHQACVDSIGCYESDEGEMASAVEMIVGAANEIFSPNGSAQH